MKALPFYRNTSIFLALIVLCGSMAVHRSHNHGASPCGADSRHSCSTALHDGHDGDHTQITGYRHTGGKGHCAACYIINHVFSRQLRAGVTVSGGPVPIGIALPAGSPVFSFEDLRVPGLRAPPYLPES